MAAGVVATAVAATEVLVATEVSAAAVIIAVAVAVATRGREVGATTSWW